MKDNCYHCKNQNIVIVENNIIVGFTKNEKPTLKEGCWGSLEEI